MAQTPRENWETQMEREFSPFHRTELKKMENALKKFCSRLMPESERSCLGHGMPERSPNSRPASGYSGIYCAVGNWKCRGKNGTAEVIMVVCPKSVEHLPLHWKEG